MPKREDFRLRPLEEADLGKVLEWRNSERVRANMYTDHIISMEEHRTWFERNKQNKDVANMIYEYKEQPIGVVNVTNIDKCNNKCYWGFYLREVDVPSGSTIMGYLALSYIFEVLDIRKLCAEVFAFNIPSIKFHKKLGFVEEGRFVKHVFKNNTYEDVIAMALFNEDWMKIKSKLEKLCFGGKSK